jgi:hypothetical protein
MAASGNSVAIKSFQSFTVSQGLLAKVVEAVKAGEKEARTSGDVKSFEVFYKGFRQNIAIGRIYIVPVKVASSLKDFPVALLYGTVVRELNLGEEVADLIEKKIGESEFDEYSQLDIQKLKDTLFYDAESEEYRSLILFAPHWTNTREYVVFKFTADDAKLSNLLRHLVFSVYFNPAVSSAFDALMTTVDTHKLDITDITPKLTYPFLSENPLREYPDFVKQGGWAKPKIFLTAKTADAITKEVLDPQELNVFEALDSALTEATFPNTEGMDEVADFKGPSGSNSGNAEIPEIGGIGEPLTACADDGTELRKRHDYGEKGSYTQEMNEQNAKSAHVKALRTKLGARFDYNATECPDCHGPLDAWKLCPSTSTADLAWNQQFCGKGHINQPLAAPLWDTAPKKGIQREPVSQPAVRTGATKQADTADNPASEKDGAGVIFPKTDKEKPVTAAAPFETPFTNVGPGTSAHEHGDKSIAVKVDTVSQKGDPKTNSPIGIAIDETGVPRRPEEERKAASIASELMRDLDDGHVAMSTKSKAARAKREAELDKIAGTIRKRADVPLTEESIWSDLMEDFGEAPQVELPGEGKSESKSTDSLPEAMTSEKPEEAKAVTEKEIDKAEPKGPKSKLFQNKNKPEEKKEEPKTDEPKKEEPKAEEKKEEPKEEEKTASIKTSALHTAASKFLNDFKKEVNAHSDGWENWAPPAKAAAQLTTLVKSGSVDVESITKALAPIKAFMTRRGLAAGMTMPKLVVKKKANEVQPDVAEAKSKVVSPDTVDTDIKQPTKSVEEAAKVGTVGVKTVKVVGSEHKHTCPKCKKTLRCNNPKDCPGENVKSALCGSCPEPKKKKGADVSSDVSEAKSEVVSPDTVDSTIKQPTKSVEEAAKVAAEVYNPETLELAQRLIDSGDDIAYDVAANTGQIFGNVKHMQWFVNAVADEIAGEEATVREYLDNKDAAETEDIMSDQPEDAEYDEHFAHIASLTKLIAKKANWYSRIVEAFGDPKKAGTWMMTPNKEFGGKTPAEVLEESNMDISVLEPFLTRMEHGVYYDAEEPKVGAAGDEQDESVEMSLGMGLPEQGTAIITASVSKTAEALYTSRNFKSKKDLKEAVAMGRKITVYDPGFGMGGETPPPDNGTCAVAGPHYPEPHRWYATVTLKDGFIVGVK